MSNSEIQTTGNQPLSQLFRVDEVCVRFEAAWKAGGWPRIEDYWRNTPEPEQSSLLKELVTLELVYRQQRGEHPSKEEYLRRFPEHEDLLRALLETVRSVRVTEHTDQSGDQPADGCSARPTEPFVDRQEGVTAKTGELATTVSSPAMPVRPESAFPQIRGFEILRLLGGGGMGVVYLARQLKPDRKVALKVLPPALAGDPERLKRFRNEAEIAAKLADCRIVPVYDVLEADGPPILVMQFIEGCDLGRIIADRQAVRAGKLAEDRHAWAALSDRAYVDQILPVLDMVLESVVALHQGQVIHRDIKPSNILIDQRNNAWLSDFGLARLGQSAGMTSPGVGIGTRGFMSPEQWEGREDVGPLSDVFSVGATLYQALTLELPYGRERVTDRSPPPVTPSKRQRLLSHDLDTVLMKAVETDQRQRYASVKELQEDWNLVRRGLLPRARRPNVTRRAVRALRRHPFGIAAGVAIASFFVLLATLLLHDPITYRSVYLSTKPPGARVVFVPLDPDSGRLLEQKAIRPGGKTPLTVHRVPAGEYLVVADLEGHGFHEVFRTVPELNEASGKYFHKLWSSRSNGSVELQEIEIPLRQVVQNMALFAGGTFTLDKTGINMAPPYETTIRAFYLDPTEVTVGMWLEVWKGLPPELPRSTPHDHAVTWIDFDQALDFAERVGKRLPDEAEYEYAATGGGTVTFPWGDEDKIKKWPLGKVKDPPFDHTQTNPPVFGLFTNAAEWTVSWNRPYPTADPRVHTARASRALKSVFREDRVVRGGPPAVIDARQLPIAKDNSPIWDPRLRCGVSSHRGHPGLGFRCARSAEPRYLTPESPRSSAP
jgi:eukaryotic-like serine/threonine-protein kinase